MNWQNFSLNKEDIARLEANNVMRFLGDVSDESLSPQNELLVKKIRHSRGPDVQIQTCETLYYSEWSSGFTPSPGSEDPSDFDFLKNTLLIHLGRTNTPRSKKG